MGGERVSLMSSAHATACPRCHARLMFCRSSAPNIDACGFESYSLECTDCKSLLGGIIDPADEALLLAPITR